MNNRIKKTGRSDIGVLYCLENSQARKGDVGSTPIPSVAAQMSHILSGTLTGIRIPLGEKGGG